MTCPAVDGVGITANWRWKVRPTGAIRLRTRGRHSYFSYTDGRTPITPGIAHSSTTRPSNVPLLVTQEHSPNELLAAGPQGTAPVLMYGPAVYKLLARGHPGRIALEMLQHLTSEESWLECVLPLPPDHKMAGSKLSTILKLLGARGKAYGHGHGFERLVTLVTMGDNVSQTWVHPIPPSIPRGHKNKKRRAAKNEAFAQRPMLGANGVLKWDDASSALQYGTVGACTPAAEAALELLLPPRHPSRKYATRLEEGRRWRRHR